MITQEENDLLCLVEGAVPMGTIMRQHWIPACMSEEVAERDGKPARVRLLGEDLVVFRDSEGRLGAIDEFCRHRGRHSPLAETSIVACAVSITAGNST